MYAELLGDATLYAFLAECDRDLAADARAGGCRVCHGPVHAARYPRKPRGGPRTPGPGYDTRESFCCARDGCRKRLTPPSLRFLGQAEESIDRDRGGPSSGTTRPYRCRSTGRPTHPAAGSLPDDPDTTWRRPRDSERSRLDAQTLVVLTRRQMTGFEVSIEGVDASRRLEEVTVARGYVAEATRWEVNFGAGVGL